MFNVKKTYTVANADVVRNNMLTNQLEIGYYRYIATQTGENQYVLKPQNGNYVVYNSYLPQLIVSLTDGEITVQYTMMRITQWWQWGMTALSLVLAVALMIFVTNKVDNIFPLLILPIICVFSFLMAAIGFRVSQRAVEKALLSAWEMA